MNSDDNQTPKPSEFFNFSEWSHWSPTSVGSYMIFDGIEITLVNADRKYHLRIGGITGKRLFSDAAAAVSHLQNIYDSGVLKTFIDNPKNGVRGK